MCELQPNAQKIIARRKLDLFIAIVLVLTVASTVLFSIGISTSRGGNIDWAFALMVMAMFLPAKIYYNYLAFLLFKNKRKKSLLVHLAIVIVPTFAWLVWSIICLLLSGILIHMMWGLVSGIIGLAFSVITIASIIIYIIKYKKDKKNEKNC